MHCSFLVSIKAFGDFVIACNSLRHVDRLPPACSELRVLAGAHLRDLARALGVDSRVSFLGTGPAFPDAYDVRRRGISRALLSTLRLRKQFSTVPHGSELIFDRIAWRERLIAARHRRFSLLPASNVYTAWARTLRDLGYARDAQLPAHAPRPLVPGLATVIPSSRIARKSIPASVLARIVEQLTIAGMDAQVLSIAGDQMQLPQRVPVRPIERTFDALIDAVGASALVVSADSLPAHLAEYLDRPVYVVSPVPNEYWLPATSFADHAWCLFDDATSLPDWLMRRGLLCGGVGGASGMSLSL